MLYAQRIRILFTIISEKKIYHVFFKSGRLIEHSSNIIESFNFQLLNWHLQLIPWSTHATFGLFILFYFLGLVWFVYVASQLEFIMSLDRITINNACLSTVPV